MGSITCGRGYRYISGEKAETLNSALLTMYTEGYKSGELSVSPEKKQEADRAMQILERAKGETDNVSKQQENSKSHGGRDITIRPGQNQTSILKKLGEPDKRYVDRLPLDKPYEEAWEYDFCVIYFEDKKVADLVFKRTPEAATYYGAPMVDFSSKLQ